ncbi:rCG21477 [Rattus norvegicus]|uniref:RCG21477 n=1 Tax=Rattus norvegicus TaxID=10116 RepID=A6J108_RAT|nr:rCG21477 [Rattus norvegicus]
MPFLLTGKRGPPSPDSVRGPFPTKFNQPVSADTGTQWRLFTYYLLTGRHIVWLKPG